MERSIITSASNQQIKHIVQLQKKAKLRNELGQFVIEGIKMYGEIPKDYIVSTYVSETFYNEKIVNNYIGVEKYEIISDKIFGGISETITPQGILAIVKQPKYNFDNIIKKESATLLFLDNLRDPGNLGTIIRTAEGAGIDGIVLSKESVDVYNPKVIRSTMGAIYRMPFTYEENFADTLKKKYINNGFELYAAHLEGASEYTKVNYPKKTGIIIGNEANGISKEVVEVANHMIKIPMEGKVESLNAAISAALIIYEVYRQHNCN